MKYIYDYIFHFQYKASLPLNEKLMQKISTKPLSFNSTNTYIDYISIKPLALEGNYFYVSMQISPLYLLSKSVPLYSDSYLSIFLALFYISVKM